MVDIEKIRKIVENRISGTELFVVDVTCSPSNEIEVSIDSDKAVDLDDCVALSRAIEEQMNRDQEDFELTVASAGVGQPLKVFRQYKKLIGSSVDVLLTDGTRILAKLNDATEDTLTLSYTAMRAVEGKKRKQPVEVVESYPMSQVKITKEYLDFK